IPSSKTSSPGAASSRSRVASGMSCTLTSAGSVAVAATSHRARKTSPRPSSPGSSPGGVGMRQPQPEVPPGGTIDTVLRFLDKPWKAIALIALAAAGVVTFALYEHRAELAEAILEGYTKPRLEKDGFTPKFASELLARTRSDLVVLTQ